MDLTALANRIGEALLARHWTLATAESCTGGWAAQALTSVQGSSHWFDRGFITYSNQAKQEMLGVRAETLAQYGAVSEQTVIEMAAGALARSPAQITLAISGIAGPGGGTLDKPVGLVCLAWAVRDRAPVSRMQRFHGDREQIRRQAVESALQGVLDVLNAR